MPTSPSPSTDPSTPHRRPSAPDRRSVPRRVRAGLALGAAVFAVGAAAAACSSSPTTTQAGSDAATSSTVSSAQAGPPGSMGGNRQAYVDCLAQHGVTVPSRGDGGGFGGGGGGGGSRGTGPAATDSATQAARDACASLRPAGGGQAFQAYATCMRDNGVTMPTAGGGAGQGGPDGTGRRTRPSLDQSDPKVAAANSKCMQLLPNGGQGGQGNQGNGTGGATP